MPQESPCSTTSKLGLEILVCLLVVFFFPPHVIPNSVLWGVASANITKQQALEGGSSKWTCGAHGTEALRSC